MAFLAPVAAWLGTAAGATTVAGVAAAGSAAYSANRQADASDKARREASKQADLFEKQQKSVMDQTTHQADEARKRQAAKQGQASTILAGRQPTLGSSNIGASTLGGR